MHLLIGVKAMRFCPLFHLCCKFLNVEVYVSTVATKVILVALVDLSQGVRTVMLVKTAQQNAPVEDIVKQVYVVFNCAVKNQIFHFIKVACLATTHASYIVHVSEELWRQAFAQLLVRPCPFDKSNLLVGFFFVAV